MNQHTKTRFALFCSILTASLLLPACTKVIDIDLNSASPLLVVEGNISDEPGPYTVKLSKTVSFSNDNNYPPVTGALVIIADNKGGIDTLRETIPGSYLTNNIVGAPGNTYSLSILAEGKSYQAVSTMPTKVPLDTIDFSLFKDPDQGESYAIIPRYTDPIEIGNNYRFFFTAKGDKEKVDKSYQVNNDDIGNGKVNQQPFFSNDEGVAFLKGDTVNVVMLCIDKNTYNYYYTLSQLDGGGPDGGATPTNPPNNIVGNKAVGIFSAYTTQTKTAIIRPKP